MLYFGCLVKEKYGDLENLAGGEESDSTSEEEDEYGELVTPEIDAQILKTITAIRSKDPKVYDSNTSFFAGIFFTVVFTNSN